MVRILSVLLVLLFWTAAAQEQKSCCVSATKEFAMLVTDPGFVATHLEPLPFKYQTERGEWVTFKTSDSVEGRAFEVKSEKPTDNVILLIHEWWGLNDYIQRETENLQKELGNVTVIALDLYDKKVATTREDAGKCMGELKDDRAKAIIKGALEYVGPKARIGTIGWCMGGGWSLQASLLAGKQGVACVMYYGMPEKNPEKLKTLNAPVLGLFASQEKWISPEVVAEFEKNMKSAGKQLTTKSYDADHAFANPSNPKYDKKATEDAHKLTIDFFKKHLVK